MRNFRVKEIDWTDKYLHETMSATSSKPSVVYWFGNNLYLNITNRCSNNCYFCFRKYKNGINRFNLRLRDEPTLDQVTGELQKVIHKKHWKEIVFCGFGEPLEKLDLVLETTKWIKKRSLFAVRVDTNGQAYLLNRGRDVIEELKEAGIDKISISFNAHNKETYNHVCKPKYPDAYEKVIEFIEKARTYFDTEITTVTIPEVNVLEIKEMAKRMGVRFRLRQYEPCFW